MSAYKTVAVDRELAFPGSLSEGAHGAGVKRVQEWLTLAAIPGVGNIAPDGAFGPATSRAVRELQRLSGLAADGVVGPSTWTRLVQPLASVTKDEGQASGLLGLEVVRAARRHLVVHPREVGGQNMGPWVRVYCDGNEGAPWAWCAGFVTYVLRQGAANSGGVPNLGPRTFSCDVLAESFAVRGKLLVQATPLMVASKVRPGDVFFVVSPSNPNDRHHTGIVVEVSGDGKTVRTAEGNTNDDGSREGYEVCERTRGVGRLDFALVR